jgi:hypothetical protein
MTLIVCHLGKEGKRGIKIRYDFSRDRNKPGPTAQPLEGGKVGKIWML